MKMRNLIALAVLALLHAGCENAVDTNVNSVPVQNDNAQIANPASTFCEEQGGVIQIEESDEGQVGYCTLASEEVCEEWAYFRGECPAQEL